MEQREGRLLENCFRVKRCNLLKERGKTNMQKGGTCRKEGEEQQLPTWAQLDLLVTRGFTLLPKRSQLGTLTCSASGVLE
jgi:hypothetical protein